MYGGTALVAATAMTAILACQPAARARTAASATAGAVPAGGNYAEQVLVTATKRSTGLQKTPIAVTVLTAATLARQHVSTIQDIVHLVPGFQATSEGDHGVITLTLRGIGNDAARTEYADPEVALFVDGVYIPRAEGATALLLDLASIEVLRGPQGTLWGRNSTAGAVNMQTSKPTLESIYGSVQAGGGDYGRIGARGFINVPITDRLAVRLAYGTEQHDGFVDYQNPIIPSLASQMEAAEAAGISAANFKPLSPSQFVTRGPKYNAQDQEAVRLSALWMPLDEFTWNISAEYFSDRGTPDANLLQIPRAGTSLYSTLADIAPYLHRDVLTIRSEMDYRISDYLALDYIAGYSNYRGSSDFDQDGGTHEPTSFASGAISQENRTDWSRYVSESHEVALKSTGSNMVDWILGGYYEGEVNAIRFDVPIFNGTQLGTVNWQGSFIQPKETVESKAVFGQATYNFVNWLHLTGGLRYTHDDRANDGGTNNGWDHSLAYPQVPLAPNQNPLQAGFSTYQYNTGSYANGKVTWLARISADITENFLTYASVSTGYKSGGLEDGGLSYAPETITSYEIGTKNRFLGGRLSLNNALYYEAFMNYQYAAPVTFSNGTYGLEFSNAGGTTDAYGFESELMAKPTPYDTIQASLSLQHTKLGYLPAAGSNDYSNLPYCYADPRISNCVNATGNELPHAPRLAAQFIWEHDFNLPNDATISPRVSTHFETSSWLSILHDGAGDRQGSYTRTDFNLIYRAPGRRHYEVEFYMQNIEDGQIRTNALATVDNIYTSQYLPPRTVGFNVTYDF